MKPRTFLISFSLLISSILKANDSTLYNKRIQKVKELYEWLSKRTYREVNVFKADTASKSWKSYDTAINLFFNKHILDSLYENRGEQDDILATSLKFQLLKQTIAGFHDLSKHDCFDKLKFKYIGSNSLIQYFIFDSKEYKFTAFEFADNSTDLIGMPILGFPEPEYKIFKEYYDKLKPCLN